MLRIRVYGKDGCKTCEKAKQKLEIMELPYEFVDIAPAIEGTAKGENPNWRNDDSVMLMAAYQLYYTLPLIRFGDEEPVDYPEAMQRCREIEKARSPRQEVAPVEQELVLA